MPDHSRWHLLAPQDVEILQPPPVEDGVWTGRHRATPLALGLPGRITVVAVPHDDLLYLHDGAPRPGADSGPDDALLWLDGNLIGNLALPPGRSFASGDGDAQGCVRLVLDALRHALGPEATRRVEAVASLGRVRALQLGAAEAVINPFQRIPTLRLRGGAHDGKTLPLLPRTGRAGPRAPDLHRLLLDGACRQIRRGEDPLIAPCDMIPIRVPTPCSAHQRLRILDDALQSLDSLGINVRPWLLPRGR